MNQIEMHDGCPRSRAASAAGVKIRRAGPPRALSVERPVLVSNAVYDVNTVYDFNTVYDLAIGL